MLVFIYFVLNTLKKKLKNTQLALVNHKQLEGCFLLVDEKQLDKL